MLGEKVADHSVVSEQVVAVTFVGFHQAGVFWKARHKAFELENQIAG